MIKSMTAVALLLGCTVLTPSAIAASSLSPSQRDALAIAAVAGPDYQPAHWRGPDFTLLYQAILMQESSACRDIPRGKDAHGCGQLQVRTAALVSGMPISAVVLDQDWTINIRIGEMYLAWCFEQTGSWQGALTCYRRGMPWFMKNGLDQRYISNVMQRITDLPESED